MDYSASNSKRVKFDHTAPPSVTSSLDPMDLTSNADTSTETLLQLAVQDNNINDNNIESLPSSSSAALPHQTHTSHSSNTSTSSTTGHLPPATTTLDEPFNTPTTSNSTSQSITPLLPGPATRIDEPSNMPPPVTKVEDAPALLIKKLSDKARLPTRGSAFAAGYDIYASKETSVPARGKALVDTDLCMAVPSGTYGRIAPRSGLAAKHFIDTGAGVIDADYRGQVKVLLFNHSDADFAVKEGDRVAQLVLERIYTPEVVEVAELEESVRGAGGFGSTGGFGVNGTSTA